MSDNKIFELYEKLYFHEVEAREKISVRLQIPLAILLSMISVYAYLIKGISIGNNSMWNFIFGGVFLVSVIFLFISMSYFIRSFYGHTYEFLPPAIETEKYRKKLIETYKEYEEWESLVDRYFNEYLFNYYNECSSANTIVNDKRSAFLHKCITYLILTALPLTAAFLIFTLSGIDKNSIDKEYKIKITNPISINKAIHVDEEKGKDSSTKNIIYSTENLTKHIQREQKQSAILEKTTSKKNNKKGQNIQLPNQPQQFNKK